MLPGENVQGKITVKQRRRHYFIPHHLSPTFKTLIRCDYYRRFLIDTPESRLKFIDTVRIAKPDIVFAHEPYNDYNPDHDMVGYLAFIARINAAIKPIETDNSPISKVPALFYYSTLTFGNFIPEYYVDITDTFELKKKMFLCHDSQQGDWCKDAFGVKDLDLPIFPLIISQLSLSLTI